MRPSADARGGNPRGEVVVYAGSSEKYTLRKTWERRGTDEEDNIGVMGFAFFYEHLLGCCDNVCGG